MSKKIFIADPVKPQKALEVQYRNELAKFGKMLLMAVKQEVLDPLKAEESSYAMDGIATNLSAIFRRLNYNFTGTATLSFAKNASNTMVNMVGRQNSSKFENSLRKATGVNMSSVISNEGLEEFMQLSVNKNVSLITSLPEEFLKKVEVIVSNGVTSGARYSTIEKQILGKAKGSVLKALTGRIKTIARNEVSTLNAQLTLRRSEALGIKEGIWRTSEDERVRGNPSGLYPKAKPNHYKLNGMKFPLAKGIKVNGVWIKPGEEINCR